MVGCVTTLYINRYFEKIGVEITTSYYLGSKLVAVKQSDTLSYIMQDHLGSTVGSVDTSGTTVSTMSYASFGGSRNATGTSPTEMKFTGQRLDTTGLYYYGARYYDPGIGRFISPDTIVQDFRNPQTLNRYAYCSNNPLKYTNPSGHWFETALDIISLVVDVKALIDTPSWENAGYVGADLLSLALPIVPAGGSIWKAIAHGDDVISVLKRLVKGPDKIIKGIDNVKAEDLLKSAKVGKNGHLIVEKKVLNEIGQAESKGVDFSNLTKEIKTRGSPGKDGSTSQLVKYYDKDGNIQFVVHEVIDTNGNIIHRDFDGVRIDSGDLIVVQEK